MLSDRAITHIESLQEKIYAKNPQYRLYQENATLSKAIESKEKLLESTKEKIRSLIDRQANS